jgi:tryptophan-rich sensory protein
MRDPQDIRTKKGTSVVVIVTRIFFAIYFLFSLASIGWGVLPNPDLELSWLLYLLLLYVTAEYFFKVFFQRGIDLSFAFPLLFAVYVLNLVSLVFRAQEEFPLLNRAEHFASFVLIGYVVWVFFIQYLPQKVWRRHPYYTSILVLAVTGMMGVTNEIVELMLDAILGTHFIGGNPWDTSLDLLMNTLGSGLFLAVRLILGAAENQQEQARP